MSDDHRLPCWVYRCERKADTYIYLAAEDAFERIPAALRDAVGQLELVMRLELHAGRTLANAEVQRVMRELGNCGYYLQLPPTRMPFEGPSAARH